jgi:hypothetical protein
MLSLPSDPKVKKTRPSAVEKVAGRVNLVAPLLPKNGLNINIENYFERNQIIHLKLRRHHNWPNAILSCYTWPKSLRVHRPVIGCFHNDNNKATRPIVSP